jgi:hypothetical protein
MPTLYDRKRRDRMKERESFWVPVLIFLGVSGGGFVALIALLVWSRTLP